MTRNELDNRFLRYRLWHGKQILNALGIPAEIIGAEELGHGSRASAERQERLFWAILEKNYGIRPPRRIEVPDYYDYPWDGIDPYDPQ